jgi:pyridinium-3,5-bisthiocarboxylic acid mononucleotide nickel chelatase
MQQGLHLHFDCASGIAGDMTLGALFGLGVDEEVVQSALASLGVDGLTLGVSSVIRGHLAAVHVQGPVESDREPSRTWRDIRRLIRASSLAPDVARLSEAIFARLARAEATVHGTDIEHVHFHEVGGLDAICDIVGIAAAISHLSPASITATPLPLGGGTVQTRHGRLPVPAPATVALLEGIPVVGGTEADGELVTPTGAAVIAELCADFGPAPPMRLVAQGYGAGTREIPGRANVVRILVGERLASPVLASKTRWAEGVANIDDMSPEWGAFAVERLLVEGASDAWQEPIVMKKGRAGVKLGFLCLWQDVERIAGILLAESTTIGVRYHAVERVESLRNRVEVDTPYGIVGIKVSGDPGTHPNVAPEFEDCRRVAVERGVPLKDVYRAALVAYDGRHWGESS